VGDGGAAAVSSGERDDRRRGEQDVRVGSGGQDDSPRRQGRFHRSGHHRPRGPSEEGGRQERGEEQQEEREEVDEEQDLGEVGRGAPQRRRRRQRDAGPATPVRQERDGGHRRGFADP
jgi:hypothetical protein